MAWYNPRTWRKSKPDTPIAKPTVQYPSPIGPVQQKPVYQGPVPQGSNEKVFRDTGVTTRSSGGGSSSSSSGGSSGGALSQLPGGAVPTQSQQNNQVNLQKQQAQQQQARQQLIIQSQAQQQPQSPARSNINPTIGLPYGTKVASAPAGFRERFKQRAKTEGTISAVVSTPFAEAGRKIKEAQIRRAAKDPTYQLYQPYATERAVSTLPKLGIYFTPVGPALITAESLEEITTPSGRSRIQTRSSDIQKEYGVSKRTGDVISYGIPTAGVLIGGAGLKSQVKTAIDKRTFNVLSKAEPEVFIGVEKTKDGTSKLLVASRKRADSFFFKDNIQQDTLVRYNIIRDGNKISLIEKGKAFSKITRGRVFGKPAIYQQEAVFGGTSKPVTARYLQKDVLLKPFRNIKDTSVVDMNVYLTGSKTSSIRYPLRRLAEVERSIGIKEGSTKPIFQRLAQRQEKKIMNTFTGEFYQTKGFGIAQQSKQGTKVLTGELGKTGRVYLTGEKVSFVDLMKGTSQTFPRGDLRVPSRATNIGMIKRISDAKSYEAINKGIGKLPSGKSSRGSPSVLTKRITSQTKATAGSVLQQFESTLKAPTYQSFKIPFVSAGRTGQVVSSKTQPTQSVVLTPDKVKEDVITSQDVIFTPQQITKMGTGTRSGSKQKPAEQTITKPVEKIKELPAELELSKTGSRTRQKQIQTNIIRTIVPPIRVRIEPPPREPKIKIPFGLRTRPKRIAGGMGGLFKVFGRRRGSFKVIGVGRTEKEALQIGKQYTSQTLAATFKVPGVTGRKITGYKTKTTKDGVLYIEKIGRRLKKGTREIPEIQQFKRILSPIKKSKKKKKK